MIKLWEGGDSTVGNLIEEGKDILENYDEKKSIDIKQWVAQAALYIDSTFESTILGKINFNDITKENTESLFTLVIAKSEKEKSDEQNFSGQQIYD